MLVPRFLWGFTSSNTHFSFILVNIKYMTKYLLHKHSGNIVNLSFSNSSGGFPICKRNLIFQEKSRASKLSFLLPAQCRGGYQRELSGYEQMAEINSLLVPLPSLIIAQLNDDRQAGVQCRNSADSVSEMNFSTILLYPLNCSVYYV